MALMEIKGYVFIFLCTEKSAYCMKNINAKSLMGIMAFGLKKGMEVSISAKGTDEKAAVDCISQFLTSNAECAM